MQSSRPRPVLAKSAPQVTAKSVPQAVISTPRRGDKQLERFDIVPFRTPTPRESKPHLPEHLLLHRGVKQMRMVHIGLGAFFKGHIATYFHELEKATAHAPVQWTLSAGNLRSDARELVAHDGTYTLEAVNPSGHRVYNKIESIKEIIRKSDHASELVAEGAKPNVGIISCTISPAGYHYNAEGKLDMAASEIQADLKGNRQTIYGVVSAMLEERRLAGRNPLAILSCDNIPQNGTRFRAALLTFLLAKHNPALYSWTKENITFPNSMVDRITPKPDEALMARVKNATGLDDKAPVMVEDYKNWVIEAGDKSFPAGRPDFEKVGVKIVDDVHPFEEAKVRMLNATHAAVAWLGATRGKGTIHETLDDKTSAATISKFMKDGVSKAIGENPHINLEEYAETTLTRFKNPALRDQVARVGRNGSAKIAQQVLPTIRQLRARGENFEAALIPVALHHRFARTHFNGERKTEFVETPEATKTLAAIFSNSDPITAYCAEPKLFGDLAGQPDLVQAFKKVLADEERRAGVATVG